MVDTFGAVIAGLIPSLGVGLLFWLAMRKIMHADRDERLALARMEQEIAAAGAGTTATSDDSAPDGVVSDEKPDTRN